MKNYVNNVIVKPNPYGPTDEKTVAAFEEVVGSRLPAEYRDYLLEFNGGKFEKNFFVRKGGIDGRIHSVYGLHAGPTYSKLTERWRLSKCYDIGESAPGVNDYLVFASTGTGDLLLLALAAGGVYFLDHEQIEDDPVFGARFNVVLISNSFDEFVESLISMNMVPN